MKAVVIRAHGGPEALLFEDVPKRDPGPYEVRMRVRAVGVNALDGWVRRGVPGHKFPLPLIPGSDGAGVVDAVGPGVAAVAVGDEVLAIPGISCGVCEPCSFGADHLCTRFQILGESRDGCCAEYVVLPERAVKKKPPGVSFEQIAAFPLVFMTAWSMLVTKAQIRPGETVLVLAAGSGVGSAAVQIAKLFGCVVLATAGGPDKCAKAQALGPDHVIDHARGSFAEAVRKLTDKRGVDVVLEHVGALTFAESLRCLARGGRLVTCGATTGADVQLNLRVLFFKNLSVLGSTMGRREDLFSALRMLELGRLRPVLDRVLPFEQVAEAHRLIEARELFGKVVLALPR